MVNYLLLNYFMAELSVLKHSRLSLQIAAAGADTAIKAQGKVP